MGAGRSDAREINMAATPVAPFEAFHIANDKNEFGSFSPAIFQLWNKRFFVFNFSILSATFDGYLLIAEGPHGAYLREFFKLISLAGMGPER